MPHTYAIVLMLLTCCYKIVHEVLSLIRLVVGFGHQHKVGTLKAYKNYPSCISYNVLRLGEGCLTRTFNFAQNFLAAFAKLLLCAGRFISTKFNLKTK